PVLEIPAAEALFWRLRHLALPSPRIEPVVDGEARQVLDGQSRRRNSRAIKPGIAQHFADDADGLLLDQRQLIALGHDLAPFVDLIVDVDLYRADVGAAAVERRGVGQIAVFANIESRINDDPDRAGIGRAIAQAAAAAVDRAGVHAGAAANAFERIPEVLHAQALRSSVVDQHDVQLGARPRRAEMRGVLRDRRAQRASRQHADEDGKVLEFRNDLLDADAGNVQLGHVGAEVGVTLVGADDEAAGLRDREIGTSHAGLGTQEIRPRVAAHRFGEVTRVVIARLRPDGSGKHLRNIAAQLVDRRDDNMAGRLVVELLDALAEIGLDHLDATGLEERTHVAFLRQHRFALDQRLGAVRREDVVNDVVVLAGIARPMHLRAVALRLGFELLEVVRKMR